MSCFLYSGLICYFIYLFLTCTHEKVILGCIKIYINCVHIPYMSINHTLMKQYNIVTSIRSIGVYVNSHLKLIRDLSLTHFN